VAGLLPAILYDPDRALPKVSSHEDPRRWVRAVIYPVRGPAGDLREVVLIHEDITEQVRADHQRQASERERERLLGEAQAAQRELETASRMKDEFLAVLSHELRTPLNAVLGWARILRSRAVGEQTAHAAAVIERNAEAQARLIDDLLDLARIITGKTQLALDQVDVGALASGALESLRPAADAKRIALALDIPEPLPILSADPQRLQQVFWNLLSNAVKFTEVGGSVAMSVVADAERVTAQVIDTGIGIPAAVLPVVFDRFTQGDSSSTRAHSGLGLGLAIVRHLVELHGGTVQAFSSGPGSGSTFTFSIPRR
jgi:signal transduction histidine kinase